MINLNQNTILPANVDYKVEFYGFSVTPDELDKRINVTVRDRSTNFVIQSQQQLIYTTVISSQRI
jgi:hypothetical protein